MGQSFRSEFLEAEFCVEIEPTSLDIRLVVFFLFVSTVINISLFLMDKSCGGIFYWEYISNHTSAQQLLSCFITIYHNQLCQVITTNCHWRFFVSLFRCSKFRAATAYRSRYLVDVMFISL